LSDCHPSGLEWRVSRGSRLAGTQAGRLNPKTGYYMVSVDNHVYLAHRIVYFLRTQDDLTYYTVRHLDNNPDKDNRKPLVATPNKKLKKG
jgi:hypothetical protein